MFGRSAHGCHPEFLMLISQSFLELGSSSNPSLILTDLRPSPVLVGQVVFKFRTWLYFHSHEPQYALCLGDVITCSNTRYNGCMTYHSHVGLLDVDFSPNTLQTILHPPYWAASLVSLDDTYSCLGTLFFFHL